MGAQFHAIGPLFHNGALVSAPRVYHYAAGTTVDQLCWLDRDQTITAPQPLVGDANGIVWAYFSGNYKLVVTTASGLVLATWDHVLLVEGEQRLYGSISASSVQLLPGATTTLPAIIVPGAVVGQRVTVFPPVPLPTVSLYGYVSAANTVTVQLYAQLYGQQSHVQFPPLNIPAGGSVFGPSVFAAGAELGDAVLAYPPYSLNGVLYTAYVNQSQEVHVRLYNSTAQNQVFPEATWAFTVLKRQATTIPAGVWRVMVAV